MDRVRPFARRWNEDHEILRHTRLCNVLLSRDSCRRCSRTRKRRRETTDTLDSTPVPTHTDRRKDESESRWSSVARKRKLTHIQILKSSMHATREKSIQRVAAFATNLCIILKKRGAKRLSPLTPRYVRTNLSQTRPNERPVSALLLPRNVFRERGWKITKVGRYDAMQQHAESQEKLAQISLGSLGSSAPLTSAIKVRESLALRSGNVAARLVRSNLRREQAGKVGWILSDSADCRVIQRRRARSSFFGYFQRIFFHCFLRRRGFFCPRYRSSYPAGRRQLYRRPWAVFTADNRNRPQTFPPLESSVCRDDSTSHSLPLPFLSRSSPRQTISLPSPPLSPITIDNTTATVDRATTRTFLLTPLSLSIRGLPLLAESSVTSCFRFRGKKIQPRHSTKETPCFLSSLPFLLSLLFLPSYLAQSHHSPISLTTTLKYAFTRHCTIL